MNGNDKIMQLVSGFQKARILLTAFELDIFSEIPENGITSEQVAKSIGADKRAVDRLMNALCSMDLLEKKNNQFFNTPDAKTYLSRHSPDYLAGLQHSSNLWDRWSTLTEAVKQGTSVFKEKINDRGENWLNSFIAAMHDRARKTAPSVITLLNLSNVSKVLDVGGGSGAYSMAFVNAKNDLKATVFDLPNVTPITSRYIQQEGFSNRINTVIGDYNKDSLGEGYDLVFLSAIVHSNSPEENIELLRKCKNALNPGGQVVVQDFILDEDRTKPPMGAIFALNMLVGTEAGDSYTESEVKHWMNLVGLSDTQRIDTTVGTSLIIGFLK